MIRIGILGGGQLARMLALKAFPLGLDVSVLATDKAEPAAQVVGKTFIGSLGDEKLLKEFLTPLDFVTFESEFIDTELLAKALPSSCKAFPALPVMAVIQDRLAQKQLLGDFKIPTAPWVEVDAGPDLQIAARRFPAGFVLKQRRFGYDGYGTFVVRDPRRADEKVLSKSKFGFIAESFVPFRRELAVSFVRSARGQFLTLPLVESVQQNSRCLSVHGPVHHKGLASLVRAFKRMMNDLDYQGALTAELFETKAGLIVNELAPRVHNSAHYSQDALTTDQFEYHVRAGLGLALPKVELVRPGFAMINLLGEAGKEIVLSTSPAGHLHWYGKIENRAGRKLGHINVIDRTGARALKRAQTWRREFKL